MKKIVLLLTLFVLGSFEGKAQTATCPAAFQVSGFPTNLCVGNSVTKTITGPSGVNFNATWNFGDGSPLVSGHSVSHTYNLFGTGNNIEVSIQTLNSTPDFPLGYTCIRKTSVNIISQPTIDFVPSCAGGVTKFYISGGVVGPVSGFINFGDGNSQYITGSTFDHTYSTQGTYTVTADITTTPVLPQFDAPCSHTTTKSIIIPSCATFECENTDFETGTLVRWNTATGLNPCSTPGNCSKPGPLPDEHELVSGSGVDPHGGFPVVAPGGGTYSLKLGNDNPYDRNSFQATYGYTTVKPDKTFFAYRFALVIEDPGIGDDSLYSIFNPSVNLVVSTNFEQIIDCSLLSFLKDWTPGMKKVPGKKIYYLPWTTHFLDLSEFVGENIFISITVNKGSYRLTEGDAGKNLFAYAYFDTYCMPPSISTSGNNCIGSPISFSADFENSFPDATFSWNMGDGTVLNNGKNISHTYSRDDTYTVTLEFNPHLQGVPYGPVTGSYGNNCGSVKLTKSISVTECAPPFVCETCIPAFSPLPGEKYIINAWVKEGDGIGKHTYEHPSIRVNFAQGTTTAHFRPAGLIIDGWQRIEGEFTVPNDAEKIWIELHNDTNTVEVFFDDIRVQPFNSSMKAFVYDPVTLRMVSELDERNYATFYEYDEEGSLARVKKETEKGIKTVKEAKESLRKRNP